MKTISVVLDDIEKTVGIAPLCGDKYRISIDGTEHAVDVRLCSPHILSLMIGERVYDLPYVLRGERLELRVGNEDFRIEILDDRALRKRRDRSHTGPVGPEVVRSVMPGKIVGVIVKPGDRVEPGAGLLIIEAMKMENEIFAKQSGIVRTVHVRPGQTVESDVALVEIVPPSD